MPHPVRVPLRRTGRRRRQGLPGVCVTLPLAQPRQRVTCTPTAAAGLNAPGAGMVPTRHDLGLLAKRRRVEDPEGEGDAAAANHDDTDPETAALLAAEALETQELEERRRAHEGQERARALEKRAHRLSRAEESLADVADDLATCDADSSERIIRAVDIVSWERRSNVVLEIGIASCVVLSNLR